MTGILCLAVPQKRSLPKPAWFKNTYFWIAAILFVLGFVGLIGGDRLIRDPGQKPESHLYLLYFGASVIMLVNGLISHRQTVQQFEEESQINEA